MKLNQIEGPNEPERHREQLNDRPFEMNVESWRKVPGDIDDFIFSMQEYTESER